MTFLKVLNIFFVALGVVFLILIIAGGLFYAFDPLGLRASFTGGPTNPSAESESEDQNPALSPAQESALETFGIDPSSVPSEFTAEQEACAEEKLGKARVDEIKAGDAPTATDYFKAKGCF